MLDEKLKLMEIVNGSSTAQAISNPQIADRFKDLYATVHGITDKARASAFYEAEKFHFLKIVNESENIGKCTKLSLYGVFMDVAVSGLSFDPTMKHLYIVPYNTNIGTKDAPKWEKRAALQISGPGELLLRTMQGQVKYADNPVIVYEGDFFKARSVNGFFSIEHEMTLPRQSDKIIAAYIKITRHDDSIDYKVMSMEDIQALRKFSKDQNSLAWTTGISGMVRSKTIKHAFMNYPKVRVGKFSTLASEQVDTETTPAIDYGTEVNNAAPHPMQQPAQQTLQAAPLTMNIQNENAAFAAQPVKQAAPAGITHDDENF